MILFKIGRSPLRRSLNSPHYVSEQDLRIGTLGPGLDAHIAERRKKSTERFFLNKNWT